VRLRDALESGRAVARSGILHPTRPDRLVRAAAAYRHWGSSIASAFAVTAARYGERTAVVDERGTVTFSELDARADAIARGFTQLGIHAGDSVGVLCRNHRYIVEVGGALAKVGAHAVYLNTGFASHQLQSVYEREGAIALIHDEEFTEIAIAAGIGHRFVAWGDSTDITTPTLDHLAARYAYGQRLDRPEHPSNSVILTSGTTGAPKGARRDLASSGASALTLLDCIPYRARETMVVAAPIFHSWGATNALTGLLFGNTIVLARHFDPEQTLAAIAQHRAQAVAAVPVMLLRLLELLADVRARYDTSSLRLVALSGSALPGDLAVRFMDAFGDVIYNLYGSTEVGVVSVASPADLRAAPATAGRPPRGTELALLDDHGQPVARGASGRIFVRGPFLFEGYTDGNTKQIIDGYMHTGDTGHLDDRGLLFVDGRDDDMIVSGGENVYPGEVEHAIATHPDVVEAAVIGVPDDEFGQRLKAFVVRRAGATLDTDGVRDHVRSTLARFKVPRDIEFVAELPHNPTGKVVKRELLDM
jgi:acyl-CoA synthetase (AMP-forming)/AMP-acid ligase II